MICISKDSIERLKDKSKRSRKDQPYEPVTTLLEDAATLDGLIDLLIIKGIIKDQGEPNSPDYLSAVDIIKKYIDRYGSAVNGLCMLLYEKGVVTQEEHNTAIAVYHEAIRHFGARACSFEEVQNFRKNVLRKRLSS